MKLTQYDSHEWQIKEGRRIVFRIYLGRDGKFRGTERCGFGLAQADTLQECVERTIAQDAKNRHDFKNRLVSLS